jgi:hypothetical protein
VGDTHECLLKVSQILCLEGLGTHFLERKFLKTIRMGADSGSTCLEELELSQSTYPQVKVKWMKSKKQA